jgi:hypothetical protein
MSTRRLEQPLLSSTPGYLGTTIWRDRRNRIFAQTIPLFEKSWMKITLHDSQVNAAPLRARRQILPVFDPDQAMRAHEAGPTHAEQGQSRGARQRFGRVGPSGRHRTADRRAGTAQRTQTSKPAPTTRGARLPVESGRVTAAHCASYCASNVCMSAGSGGSGPGQPGTLNADRDQLTT